MNKDATFRTAALYVILKPVSSSNLVKSEKVVPATLLVRTQLQSYLVAVVLMVASILWTAI